MADPAIQVLDEDAAELDALRDALELRYGREYVVSCAASTAEAMDRLAAMTEEDRSVALVCAPSAMLETGGADFMAAAQRGHPTTKRVLILPRGGPAAPSLRVPALMLQDGSVAQPVLRAMSLGVVDTYLASPHGSRDEGFHLAISELLEEWARDSAPDQPAVQIVGRPVEARSHELRDVLNRNGIPFDFLFSDTGRAQALLADSGQSGTRLPVVITNTGGALVDPTNDALGAAFGLASHRVCEVERLASSLVARGKGFLTPPLAKTAHFA